MGFECETGSSYWTHVQHRAERPLLNRVVTQPRNETKGKPQRCGDCATVALRWVPEVPAGGNMTPKKKVARGGFSSVPMWWIERRST